MTVRKASKATERAQLVEHSKAAFIRQHLNLPAREIIARAKSVGLVIDRDYVYAARYSALGKKKASPLGTERSDVSREQRRDGPSKAAFIRQVLELPTREVVRRGKLIGLAIRPEYVRRVRERAGVGNVSNPTAFIRHHLDRPAAGDHRAWQDLRPHHHTGYDCRVTAVR